MSAKQRSHNARRNFIAVRVYKAIVTFAFLVAAFNAWPSYTGAIALAVIALSATVAVATANVQVLAALQNEVDDLAERKTRHAILLARDHDDSTHFWSQVDENVREEKGIEPDAPSAWVQTGFVLMQIGLLLASDLIAIVLALALA
jgi:hypothetical protein